MSFEWQANGNTVTTADGKATFSIVIVTIVNIDLGWRSPDEVQATYSEAHGRHKTP